MADIGVVLRILNLPRSMKQLIVIGVDGCFCLLSVWLAFCLRSDSWVMPQAIAGLPVLVSLVIAFPIFVISGFYRAIFRYSGWLALLAMAKAIFYYSILFSTLFTVISVDGISRSIGILQPILLFLLVSASRLLVRYYLGDLYVNQFYKNTSYRALIYGAGAAGQQLAAHLVVSHDLSIMGYLDDNSSLWN